MQSSNSLQFVETLKRSLSWRAASGAVAASPSRPGAVSSRKASPRKSGLSSLHNSPSLESEIIGFDEKTMEVIYSDPIMELAQEGRMAFTRRLASGVPGASVCSPYHGITFYDGGSAIRLQAPRIRCRPVGGERSIITGFSPASKMRLLWFFNKIDQRDVNPLQMWFVTLTYPKSWPDDPREWKKHLDRWRKRLERAWGRMAVVWKLEFQSRGAPHFHLIIRVSPEMAHGLEAFNERQRGDRIVRDWRGGQLREFRQWCSRAWYEVVGSNDVKHLKAGTNVEPLMSWKRVMSYAAKYLGKDSNAVHVDPETGEAGSIGRFWGVWRRELFPHKMVKQVLAVDAYKFILRTCRRYAEHVQHKRLKLRRHPTDVRWFIPAEIVKQCIDYLDWDIYPPWQRPQVVDRVDLAAFGIGEN